MSEFITVQVGQCGNQIGSAFWPLVLHEHGVQTSSGGVHLLKVEKNRMKNMNDLSDAFHSFFYVPRNTDTAHFKNVTDLAAAKVKARAVLIDMEDSVVSRFKQGPLCKLFDQTCTVTNYPGSGNNWAIGYHAHGTEYHDLIEETLRRTVEKCDQLHGFLLLHSLGGGTGSGLGTAALKLLSDSYPRIDRYSAQITFGNEECTEDVITAPYNVLLATRQLIDHATCVFPVENRSLLELCNAQITMKSNTDQARYNALCEPFQDMNSIIVNMLLHLTSGSRFPGSLNVDISELATNLVPYPNLHFIISGISPISLTATGLSVSSGSKLYNELFMNAWSRKNRLLKVDPSEPNTVILGTAFIGRGNIPLSDLKRNIERFQSKAKFTSWSKEVMKIGLCSVPAAGHSTSLLSLINSSAISSIFKNITQQFTSLYRKKAHVHHYTKVNGFEEEDFVKSKEAVINLWEQYKDLQNQKPVDIPRLQII